MVEERARLQARIEELTRQIADPEGAFEAERQRLADLEEKLIREGNELGAELAPDFERLFKASEFAWRAGDFPAALRFGEDLLRLARAGDDPRQLGTALNEHALTLRATGRSAQAEPLYREALEITRETLGPRHPALATTLDNLAGLLRATGRAGKAVPLYLEALGIVRASLGDAHPNTCVVAGTTLRHLRQHAPDHPDLPGLAEAFPDL